MECLGQVSGSTIKEGLTQAACGDNCDTQALFQMLTCSQLRWPNGCSLPPFPPAACHQQYCSHCNSLWFSTKAELKLCSVMQHYYSEQSSIENLLFFWDFFNGEFLHTNVFILVSMYRKQRDDVSVALPEVAKAAKYLFFLSYRVLTRRDQCLLKLTMPRQNFPAWWVIDGVSFYAVLSASLPTRTHCGADSMIGQCTHRGAHGKKDSIMVLDWQIRRSPPLFLG